MATTGIGAATAYVVEPHITRKKNDMPVSCRITTGPAGEGTQEIREFLTVPRVGESIVVAGSNVSDSIFWRVKEVAHSFQPGSDVAEIILIVGPRTPA